MALYTWAQTLPRLGLSNVARVARYRLGLRLATSGVRRLQAATPTGPFFGPCLLPPVAAPTVSDWRTSARLFSFHPIAVATSPPDWLANPMTGERIRSPDRPWWDIPDFDAATGDIKLAWELSRMDWALALAQRARQGDAEALATLDAWLQDWCLRNPPYLGPNWKCGQEASIRVMHLAMVALVLGQARQTQPGMLDLLRAHLQRIEPTVQYAIAQDNNHATSEAAALYIGGSWLQAAGLPDGSRWQEQGRRLLESSAARLVGEQGSFSQYSTNYHRVLLDTFSMVEAWRRHLQLPPLSSAWLGKAEAAARWLHSMTQASNGDAPCLGANDGARLLQLVDAGYRDHRPSVQLAMALFAGQRAYGAEGHWNHPLAWLGVDVPGEAAPAPTSQVFDDGGFAVLHSGDAMAVLRYPRFRFRPSQADALHLDLWLGGDNLLRDAGSYGYGADAESQAYFPGTASHNTVQFDDRDQMPRLGRFLFGRWLAATGVEVLREQQGAANFAAGYRDHRGACHQRSVQLRDRSLRVQDRITGFRDKAVLRWRLAPGAWHLQGTTASNGRDVLAISTNMPLAGMRLVEGWESRHYLQRSAVPVLEVETTRPGTISTEYTWMP